MKNNRVMLAMSGGTDSSMCAILLQEQGYEVEGVTFWMSGNDKEPDFIDDARQLAEKLKIKHHVMDIRDTFVPTIINSFKDEYLAGRTPNPCVLCNNTIKWPFLQKIADERDCFYLASGHYALTETDGTYHYISEGADDWKEQSFFLWGLPQETIQRIMFPLGQFTKPEVRQMAADRGFQRVATKRDSMGVCFIDLPDYRPYLERELEKENRSIPEGNYIDDNGTIVGKHQGFPFYTLGQRRGLGIHLNRALYVTKVDPIKNEVILGKKSDLETKTIYIKDYNFVNEELVLNERLNIRIRYRKQEVMGRVIKIDDKYAKIELEENEIRESAGQTATFYYGKRVVGGGWIVDSIE